MEKICKKCGTSRDINDFYIRTSSKDGRKNTCRFCVIKRSNLQAKEFLEHNLNTIYPDTFLIRCSICKEEKEINNFCKKRTGKHGRGKWCNSCVSEKGRIRRREKPEEIKRTMREWKANNLNRVLLNNCRHRSNKSGIEFSIELSDIIIPEYCPVFGMKLELQTRKSPSGTSPSIDRIDSKKGYIKGNIRVISWLANTIKGSGTAEQHELIAKYIRENE